MKQLVIRRIVVTGHSPNDKDAIYTCEVCSSRMRYKDIWVVEDLRRRTMYISCCSQLCGETAILQNI